MKKSISIIVFTLSAFLFAQEHEDKFWSAWLAGDYETAACAAESCAAEIPEYYMLAAVCQHNIFNYYRYDIFKAEYKNSITYFSPLVNLLYTKEKEYPDHYQIFLLEGLVRHFLPQCELVTAKDSFIKSLKLEKENPIALNYLSMLYFREGKIGKAKRYAKKAIKLKPDFPEPYCNLAVACKRSGNTTKALKILFECLQNSSAYQRATYANIILMTCTPQIVIENDANLIAPVFPDWKIREKVYNMISECPVHFIGMAEEFISRSSYVEVGFMLREITCPDGYENDFAYVNAKYQAGNDVEKFDRYATILYKGNYAHYQRLFEIAHGYTGFKRYDQAIAFYKKVLLQIDPIDKAYQLKTKSNIGYCYLNKRNSAEAERWLKQALDLDPEDSLSWYNLAKCYYMVRNVDQAMHAIEKAEKFVSPQNANLVQNIKAAKREIERLTSASDRSL